MEIRAHTGDIHTMETVGRNDKPSSLVLIVSKLFTKLLSKSPYNVDFLSAIRFTNSDLAAAIQLQN